MIREAAKWRLERDKSKTQTNLAQGQEKGRSRLLNKIAVSTEIIVCIPCNQ
jgi:hypothetical protein